MGGVAQQINLYRGNEAERATHAGARLLLFAGLGALAAVLTLGLVMEFYLAGVSTDRAEVAKNLRQREIALAGFKETLASRVVDPHLESELAALRETRARLNANLAAITQHTGSASNGFAAFFAGLARNTLDGLWLSNVGVSAGGSEMLLKGQTTEPALVPRLLQTLAGEGVFAGRTFRKVTFERQKREAGALVDFELRSAKSGEGNDAG